ncbi:MAG: 1-(5-phosphoribosyl)-5-amino-4-imidazole-carboxylate carboxylase, partial [Candidatus Lindowbacteria bacterium]|nr:1-(5-phosphoribosyl)-5-amino-4-imidazole-carboxylate carboxylase [Candidatus Lindowbacteria bacterium]
MNRDRLIELLGEVKSGATSIEKATEDLAQLPFVSVDSANIDTHRELRTGMPEVVFGQGKTVDEIVQITQKIVEAHGNALITRLSQEAAAKLVEAYPNHRYLERSKIIWINPNPESEGFDIDSEDYVAVVSAGTSDIPVADEAALTVQACNKSVKKVYDCGI